MPVIVPDVIGLGKPNAVAALSAVRLRHLGHLTFDAVGAGGSATEQDPHAVKLCRMRCRGGPPRAAASQAMR